MVSVIVPAYNIEEYLPRCLDSILNQSYRDLEIILVDDGSTDSTGVICDEYAEKDSRVVVIHKENGGVSSARNLGLDRAKGDYIGFVDGDDVIDPNMYQVLVKNAIEYEVDISCCQLTSVHLNGEKEDEFSVDSQILSTEYIVKHYFFDSFVKEMMYSQCNKIFHRSIVGNLRYKEYKYGEDILFVFEAIAKTRKVFYDRYVGYYYLHRGNSAMKRGFTLNRMDYILAIREIERICKIDFPYACDEAQCWVYMHVLNTMRQVIMWGEQKKLGTTFVEEKRYLKENANKFLPKLGKKKRMDYIGVQYFPVYIHLLRWIKGGKQ